MNSTHPLVPRWTGSLESRPELPPADLWWPRAHSGKCDLCERTSVPTAKCTRTEDGVVANLCVFCWAFEDDAFRPLVRIGL